MELLSFHAILGYGDKTILASRHYNNVQSLIGDYFWDACGIFYYSQKITVM